MLADSLTVVCHQVRSVENLGAVARVMANFGFGRLVLSDPVTWDFREAGKLAIGAEQVVKEMAVARDLREALRDVTWACATTSRAQLRRQHAVSPEEAVRHLTERARAGRVALVLGGEKRGLSDEELAECQEVLAISTSPAQPSMNLSHAASVLLYLCSREGEPPPNAPVEAAAPLEAVQALEQEMERVLLAADFLNAQAPQHVRRELVRTLVRAGLTPREAQLWLSAWRHLGRAVDKGR